MIVYRFIVVDFRVNYFVDASTFLLEYMRRNALEIFGNKKKYVMIFRRANDEA